MSGNASWNAARTAMIKPTTNTTVAISMYLRAIGFPLS